MNFEHTEDRRMLADTLNRFVAEQYGIETRNHIAYGDSGMDAALWSRFAELGAIGALFPEADGGFGGAGFDVAVVFEALGRGLVVEPFLGALVVGAWVAVMIIRSTTAAVAQGMSLAQAIALIPGTSRSGITMTAGLMLGLTRQAAARFSFLISIPIILLAGGYQSLKLLQSEQAVDWTALGLGTVLSFISAYVCIHFFLKVIEKMGMLPFVIYRLLLGVVLLLVLNNAA